jgi:HK97 gp10 family phage protein
LSIRVKVEDKPRYKVVEANYRKAIERIIVSGVQNTMNTAKQSIQQHGSSGATYEKYNPRRTHTASSAGNPPNTDTGFLVSNIHAVIDPDRLGGSVESRADYSGFLEFGTSKMKARPYLQPALEENKPKIRAKFRTLGTRFK